MLLIHYSLIQNVQMNSQLRPEECFVLVHTHTQKMISKIRNRLGLFLKKTNKKTKQKQRQSEKHVDKYSKARRALLRLGRARQGLLRLGCFQTPDP